MQDSSNTVEVPNPIPSRISKGVTNQVLENPNTQGPGQVAYTQQGPVPKQNSRFYLPHLDGLRFFAFLCVFISHTISEDPNWWTQKGFPFGKLAAATVRSGSFGVDLFFVLSSFLITEILLREVQVRGRLNIKSFYARRILRIWPLFYIFLIFAILAEPLANPSRNFSHLQMLGYGLFFGNWTCAFLGYPSSIAAPLWSVSLEEQFYLLWPFVIQKLGVNRLPQVTAALFLVALFSRMALNFFKLGHPAMWCSTFTRLDSIGVGVGLAIMLRKYPLPKQNHGFPFSFFSASLTVLLLWVLPELYWPLAEQSWVRALVCYSAVALGSAILILVGLRTPWLSQPTLVYLGRISYGLYVFHALAIKLCMGLLPFRPIVSILGAFVVTVVLASLSYKFIELPFLALKEKYTAIPNRAETK